MYRKAMDIANTIVGEDMGVKKAYQYAKDNYPSDYHGPGKVLSKKDWVLAVMSFVDELADVLYNSNEVAYADMSLGDLRRECKNKGIKYVPAQREAELIEMLKASNR